MPGLRLMVLARIACDEGATRPELARELSGFVGTGPLARVPVEAELAQLVRAGFAVEAKARFSASQEGLGRLLAMLGMKGLPRTWAELRDVRLVAKSLGLEGQSASRIKGLANADTLRGEILAHTFGLKLKGAVSTTKLRAGLALVALDRAFGNRIKAELTASAGLNAKASRVLAGQLLRKPRDPGTDKRLVAMLAAGCVGSTKLDNDGLRAALLRRLASGAASTVSVEAAPRKAAIVAELEVMVARDGGAPVAVTPELPQAASRPDLPGFVRVVQASAATCAEGWPGNRKALVSRVFSVITAAHPGWGLSLVEFKAMLAECHRIGKLALVTADLKDKGLLDDLRQSAITYKNTVWHLVRVEE